MASLKRPAITSSSAPLRRISSTAALSWLGAVRGQPVRALGMETFGQSGDLPDLYARYRLDADAILDACADLMV